MFAVRGTFHIIRIIWQPVTEFANGKSKIFQSGSIVKHQCYSIVIDIINTILHSFGQFLNYHRSA